MAVQALSGRSRFWQALAVLGPGLAIAATGVGAGDMIAAAVSGSKFGFAIVWAAAVGAVFKFVLNEGLARWQLATGTTLLEGWANHLGRGVQWIFMVYLVLWSFVVGGALVNACGLAAHALVPQVSLEVWAVAHSIVAAVVVLAGGYTTFERSVKVFIGVMFAALIGCALFVAPPLQSAARSVREAGIPEGSGPWILGVLGGVGGSVTLLSYGYWIREKGWEGKTFASTVRLDLVVAYGLTGVFGVAVVILAAHTLYGGEPVAGSGAALMMATMLEQVVGPVGRWAFLIGFWGAVATSMLGVWQGVPYLFADFLRLIRGYRLTDAAGEEIELTRTPSYRIFLFWLAIPPLSLLAFGKPVLLVVIYSVMGALFIPFLAATLLFLNGRRKWVGSLRNGPVTIAVLAACLLLFGYIAFEQLGRAFETARAFFADVG
jgi:Mn2+/Fe2+ NRAMP family transporter